MGNIQQQKNWEKAVSLTASIFENLAPFLSYIKRQNTPKYGNLSRNFHIYLTALGEGGVNPSGQPDRFFPVFFLRLPLSSLSSSFSSSESIGNRFCLMCLNVKGGHFIAVSGSIP